MSAAARTSSKKSNFLKQFRDENSKKFKELTAAQFIEVWNHYDVDGNGYIEGSELDGFLRELASSVNSADHSSDEVIPDSVFKELRKSFMEAYDENGDGKISVNELAEILPTEENFLLLFRRDNPLDSSVEFMRIWRQFDKDASGYIEADELKQFIKKLLESKRKENVSEEKLIEYADTILQIFDSNGDGKLQFSEMTKLLPVKENFLQRPVFKDCSAITQLDLDKVFSLYDIDTNGYIEKDELDGFVKDLLELVKTEYDAEDLKDFKNGLLAGCDLNRDGRISKSELKMILIAISAK